MKRLQIITKKIFIITLILAISIPIVSNAQGKGYDMSRKKALIKENRTVSMMAGRDDLLEEKDALEAEKDSLEEEKDTLENAMKVAEAEGDEETAAKLSENIRSKKQEMEQIKIQLKGKKLEVKLSVRASYTEEELAAIEEIRESLALRFKNAQVLPVESIIARGRNMKFDTPPVIKDGRTLIPVRAVSEAFGAEVTWDPIGQTVTILKGETEIVLEIGSLGALVNGEEAILDVPSEIMGGRTVIPLRFVVENLGLTVDWDEETETVEIGDGEELSEAIFDEGETGEAKAVADPVEEAADPEPGEVEGPSPSEPEIESVSDGELL
jgi:hypothetical protein